MKRLCRSTQWSSGSGAQCSLRSGHRGWHKNQSGDPELWWKRKRKRPKKEPTN